MKSKTVLMSVLFVFLIAGTANAQVSNLPSAGITPQSPFYFLDRFAENLREFFTFNPEAKAKLQVEFAGERIAEIKVMVEKDGDAVKGIKKAETLLLGNVAQAARVLQKEKTAGKSVTQLAKQIDDSFDAQEKLLIQTFQDARKKLKKDRLALRASVKGTNVTDVKDVKKQLQSLGDKENQLKDIQDNLKVVFNDKQAKIEDELNKEDKKNSETEKAKEDIKDAREEVEIEKIDKEDESEKVENEQEVEREDNKESESENNNQDIESKKNDKGVESEKADNENGNGVRTSGYKKDSGEKSETGD